MTDYSRTDADLPEGRFANGDTVTLGDGSKWVFAADRWNAVALGSASKTQVVTATPSGPGLEIQDGSDTRSFLTAEMSDGVPTGNFS